MTHELFEKTVMDMLLAGDDEYYPILRNQYAQSMVASREFTGVGFFTTFSLPENSPPCSVSGRVNDVQASFDDGEVYYFILYITDGKIDTLEGFRTHRETWSYDYDKAEISYCFEDRRDVELRPNIKEI
jgi:hypothetical protein